MSVSGYKLAVSNIAWSAADQREAYDLLASRGVRGLEVAPGMLLPDSISKLQPTASEIERALHAARSADLQLVSMQSLLFGVTGATLFGPDDERATLANAMRQAIKLAEHLGIPNLVFGSPKQRIIPNEMPVHQAQLMAAEFFRELGDAAVAAGTQIAIEPNPVGYGTNFLNTLAQVNAFVSEVDHPGVTINLDIGAMHMNDDLDTLHGLNADTVSRISHVHISEPGLGPAAAQPQVLSRILKSLSRAGYARWYSIEMQRNPETGVAAVAGALDRVEQAIRLSHISETQQ